jgi:uncharacterized protein YdhG (YjbR/CyaY superfamily)
MREKIYTGRRRAFLRLVFPRPSLRDLQTILQKIRRTIKADAPAVNETISDRMPAFKQNGKAAVYFAAPHCSMQKARRLVPAGAWKR